MIKEVRAHAATDGAGVAGVSTYRAVRSWGHLGYKWSFSLTLGRFSMILGLSSDKSQFVMT
jgi:hypothetical protein